MLRYDQVYLKYISFGYIRRYRKGNYRLQRQTFYIDVMAAAAKYMAYLLSVLLNRSHRGFEFPPL
jgi:hypothetical protein